MTTNPRRPKWWESPFLERAIPALKHCREAAIRSLERRKARRALSTRFRKGFDSAWLRRLTTLVVICTPVILALDMTPAIPAGTAQTVFMISTFAATGLLCAYYAQLMFLRLQCSLLEWCVFTVFLGNAEGLLVTTPGFTGVATLWPLMLLVAAWVLYGVVRGLVRASIWGVTEPARRVWFILAAWFVSAVPALLISGVVILAGRSIKGMVAQRLVIWGWGFVALGVAGSVFHFWLERKTNRKARALLEAAAEAEIGPIVALEVNP